LKKKKIRALATRGGGKKGREMEGNNCKMTNNKTQFKTGKGSKPGSPDEKTPALGGSQAEEEPKLLPSERGALKILFRESPKIG